MAEHAGAVTERSTIVVANALAAQQWEMHLAAEPIRAAAAAWETPPVKSYAAWLDELWLEHADAARSGAHGESVVRVVAPRRRGVRREQRADRPCRRGRVGGRRLGCTAPLADRSGCAAGRGESRRLPGAARLVPRLSRVARRQRLDRPSRARSGVDGRHRRAGQACRRRSRRAVPGSRTACSRTLVAHGHDDRGGHRRLPLTGTLSRRQARRRRRRAARGARMGQAASRGQPVRARRRRRARRPRGAKTRSSDWRQPSSAMLAPQPYWSEGRSSAREPAIGAAFDALRLSGAHAPYATFGRWLRSPFFARQSRRAVRARTARRRAARRAALAAAVPSGLSLRSEGAARNTRTALGARARRRSRCHRWRAPCDSGSVGASMDALACRARLATAHGRARRCSDGKARSTSWHD